MLIGALAAGFVTGLAGFGNALIASGFWFHALPAVAVPPLNIVSSAIAQLASLHVVWQVFDWRHALPYLVGGLLGVPIGVFLLSQASPELIRGTVGVFLIAYSAAQLSGLVRFNIGRWGGSKADGVIGMTGGILGGFAGLSGPAPLVWLQLRGGSPSAQRAVYQPFNLTILTTATVGVIVSGQFTWHVLQLLLLCLPALFLGSWLGVRAYRKVDPSLFRLIVLVLLGLSGVSLVGRNLLGG